MNCTADASAKKLALTRDGRLDQVAEKNPDVADHVEARPIKGSGLNALAVIVIAGSQAHVAAARSSSGR